MQKRMTMKREIFKKLELQYLLYVPKDYERNNHLYPLVIFLHGAGEMGDDLERVKANGVPKLADKADFPFIAISPQCPFGSQWELQFEELDALTEELINNYRVDINRIYLTGISMGGFGTWNYALMHPDRFAAIIPICGGIDYPELIHLLKDVPIWAFHGREDDIVPVEESIMPIEALKKCGSNAKLTIYENTGHDAWTRTYEDAELYEWMLAQRKPNDRR